jgi:hypothetical protein
VPAAANIEPAVPAAANIEPAVLLVEPAAQVAVLAEPLAPGPDRSPQPDAEAVGLTTNASEEQQ